MKKTTLIALLGLSLSCAGLKVDDHWSSQTVGQNRLAMGSRLAFTNHDAGPYDDLNVTTLEGYVDYGHRIDRGPWEPGVRFGFSHARAELGDMDADETSLMLVGNLRYYLNTDTPLMPWVQAFAGPATVSLGGSDGDDESASSLLVGASLGLSAFVSQDVSFELDLTLRQWEFDDVDSSDVAVNLGIAIHW